MTYYMTPDYQRAKGEAIRLLQEFGLEKPPVNPMDIAQHLGVRVSSQPAGAMVLLDKYWENLPVIQLSELFVVSVPVIRNRISFEYGA